MKSEKGKKKEMPDRRKLIRHRLIDKLKRRVIETASLKENTETRA